MWYPYVESYSLAHTCILGVKNAVLVLLHSGAWRVSDCQERFYFYFLVSEDNLLECTSFWESQGPTCADFGETEYTRSVYLLWD